MTQRLSKNRCAVLGIMMLVYCGVAFASAGQPVRPSREATILAYSISPGGARMAETELGGSAARASESIVITDITAARTVARTIFVGHGIGAIYWSDADHILFTESGTQTVLWRENVATRARHALYVSPHPIAIAAFDRERGLIAFSYAVTWKWHHRVSARVTSEMTTLDLLEPSWARWPQAYVVGAIALRIEQGRSIAVPIRLAKSHFALLPGPMLMWDKGRLLAIVSSTHSWHTRIFNLETNRRWHHHLALYRIFGDATSHSGDVAFVATHDGLEHGKFRCGCIGSMNIFWKRAGKPLAEVSAARDGGFIEAVSRMWWGAGGHLFAQVMGFRHPGGPVRWWLEELNARTDQRVRTYSWPHGDLGGGEHQCVLDAARSVALCVAQTLADPPVLMRINLRTGAMRPLGKLDPGERRLNFHFRTVRIRNRFGFQSTAFLALPRDAAMRPVPLAVMAYGFTEAYSRDAQWITSYPVAKFVHAGIAVLLLNWARTGSTGKSPYQQSKRGLESALSLFHNAVPAVEALGVHVSRAMAMGWSFGGLFVAHAIQSLPDYVAAQVGDPASYTVTEYGLGNEYWRHVSATFFGGAPIGRYLNRYAYFDPVHGGKVAKGPILFEFVCRNPGAGQLLQEWQAVGTEVEAFAYRHSVHWLSVPAEARISRQRNLDWAKINLFGPSSVPARQLQRVGLTVPRHGWWNEP